MHEARPIWSIGHSNHEMATMLELLRTAQIDVVADLRSQPFSRFKPHFNRRPFQKTLKESGFDYVFLGDELGGRPPEQEFFDDDGHVLYGEVARTPRFLEGLDRLLRGAERFRVAMLCSEEDPSNCHRRLLVTRVLTERGVPVSHIRGDGSTISEDDLAAALAGCAQPALFAGEEAAWRSTRSVSRSTPLRTSSAV
jgi:uncharacterized protein (DUF488 family)